MRALDKKRKNASSVYLPRAFFSPVRAHEGVCTHDRPVDKLNDLEETRDMRTPKTECMRAGVHT